MVCFMTHFLVPSIIMKDLQKTKMRVLNVIRDYNDKMKKKSKAESDAARQGGTVVRTRRRKRRTASSMLPSFSLCPTGWQRSSLTYERARSSNNLRALAACEPCSEG